MSILVWFGAILKGCPHLEGGGGSAKSRELQTGGRGGSTKCGCPRWKKKWFSFIHYYLEILSVQYKCNVWI